MEKKNLSFLGYPHYSVDTEGNVWSHKGEKVRKLKGGYDKHGYLIVGLSDNGIQKKFLIHRLVGLAFIPNPDNKPHIDHINTNRNDNRVCNLRWCTCKENNNNPISIKHYSISKKGENHPFWGKHHSEETKHKISEASKGKNLSAENNPMFGRLGKNNPKSKVVLQYTRDGEFVGEYYGAAEAQRITNIAATHITACCKEKLKTCGGFVWKYKEESE